MTGNEVSKVQLCEECAKKMEETTEAANLLAFIPQILSGLQGMEEQIAEDVLSGELLVCENCGTTFNDFQKMGYLGCASCYRSFSEPLGRIILEFQEADEHRGKIPVKGSEGARLRKQVVELEKRLEKQIAEEEYESAAAVRDQIKEIRTKLSSEGRDGEE